MIGLVLYLAKKYVATHKSEFYEGESPVISFDHVLGNSFYPFKDATYCITFDEYGSIMIGSENDKRYLQVPLEKSVWLWDSFNFRTDFVR